VPKSLVRVYRDLFDPSRARERRSHATELADPRSAADHRIAHQRSLDHGGEGCPFCR
jgi:hypothetical protein